MPLSDEKRRKISREEARPYPENFSFFPKNFLSTPDLKKILGHELIAAVNMLCTPVCRTDASHLENIHAYD